jgi:hypothetical protein
LLGIIDDNGVLGCYRNDHAIGEFEETSGSRLLLLLLLLLLVRRGRVGFEGGSIGRGRRGCVGRT